MTTAYGIIDIAVLEAYTCKDYSSYVDSDNNRLYSDTNIEAWISMAERLIVSYCKKTYTNTTAPNDVIFAVTYMAGIFANNQLIKDGLTRGEIIEPLLPFMITNMLDQLLSAQIQSGLISEVSNVDDWDY